MPEIKDVYIEFFGDPSDDKECYKRYSSTEPFQPCGNDAEVIHFVNAKEVERLRTALHKIVDKTVQDPAGEVELRARAAIVYTTAYEALSDHPRKLQG